MGTISLTKVNVTNGFILVYRGVVNNGEGWSVLVVKRIPVGIPSVGWGCVGKNRYAFIQQMIRELLHTTTSRIPNRYNSQHQLMEEQLVRIN